MNEIVTHQTIAGHLCGIPQSVETGFAKVELTTTREMAVDDKGLVHGGFIFGLADYAAMIAVNNPNVVLGAAQSLFKKPVQAGDSLVAEANVIETKKNKRIVNVTVLKESTEVFQGTFTCFVLDRHVLDSTGG
jgi:uncharacterized protein (TIGR00369 family)